MTRSTIRIPEILDEHSIRTVLGQLNLLVLGQTSWRWSEVYASLKWARVSIDDSERFADALEQHGLISEPTAIPPRAPLKLPLFNKRQ